MKRLLTIIICLFSLNAFAIEGVYTVIIKKQEEKKKTRWSLAGWLGTKKRIALMDQWLALHTAKDLFEMSLGGGSADFDFQDGSGVNPISQSGVFYDLSLAYSIVGLRFEVNDFDTIGESKDGQIFLRLLGTSDQSTGLSAFYGMREFDLTGFDKFKQSYYGGTFRLYLLSFLGADATIKFFSKEKGETTSYELEGERTSWGPFVELGPFRFYGEFFSEQFKLAHPTAPTRKKNSGTKLGLKIFF